MEGSVLSRGECEIAMSMTFTKNDNHLTISSLAERMNLNRTNPLFYRLLGHLYDSKIVSIVKEIGPTKFLKINIRALRKFIWAQPYMQKYIEYFKRNHILIYS